MSTDLRDVLLDYEYRLLHAPRRRLLDSLEWDVDVPHLPGVYAIWDHAKRHLVYVGETSDLKSRFGDLRRSVNHTFRRKARVYVGLRANAPEHQLTAAMAEAFELAFLPVAFGRSETEEYLVLRYRDSLLNKPASRLLRGEQYNWVMPA